MSGSMTDEMYVSRLTMALRLRDVPGPRIGDIVAEVETYVAESGESAQQAFGDPEAYAASCAPGTRGGWGSLLTRKALFTMVVAGVGGWLAATGLIEGIRGVDHTYGIGPWWVMGIGLALLLGVLLVQRADVIVDPRTDRAWPASPAHPRLVLGAMYGGLLLLAGLLGLAIDRL